MISIPRILMCCVLLAPLQAYSEDAPSGKALHQKSCQGCHDNSVYTRKNRQVTSLAGLGKRVRICRQNLNVDWFDDETDAVISYMDQTFYHFGAATKSNQ